MIDKDRDYNLIIKIYINNRNLFRRELHKNFCSNCQIFRRKKKRSRSKIYVSRQFILGQNFEKKFAKNRGARGAKRSLSSLQMRRYRSSITEAVYVHRTRPVGYIATSIFNQRRRATDKICIRLYIGTNLKSKYISCLCLFMGLGTESVKGQ